MNSPAGSLRVLIGSANERDGGAAVAAGRLRDGLLTAGQSTLMFVQTPGPTNPSTLAPKGQLQRTVARARSGLDALPLRRYPARKSAFAVNWLPRFFPAWPNDWNADIVHLHWINAGFMSLRDMTKIRQPVVWTMHDMWPITGGCQYDEECGRYVVGCGKCPVLKSSDSGDISARRLKAKRSGYRDMNLTVVSPTRWLAECAGAAPVFSGKRIEVIRNGLDLQKFKPLDRVFARHALGLPQGRPVILFGAVNANTDPRKGHDLLQNAMARLRTDHRVDGAVLAVFGSSPPRREISFGFETFHFGHLNDDISLALLYAASDVFVAPSRQDNLPNTVAEALACGTPCVAFKVGGMPDLINHQNNGYLAKPFDPIDLAEGLVWSLKNDEGHAKKISEAARRFALDELDLNKQTQRHLELYRELLQTREEQK